MITMAAASTDTTGVVSGDAVPSRRRGKSKAPNFTYDGPVSVIRLQLDVGDSVVRRRVEAQWAAAFRLRRALQRDAAARCRAYWAARRERGVNPKAVRERLGLSRKAIEAAAKGHIEASGWMRDHLTKAVGLHVADEVAKPLIGTCSPIPLGAVTAGRVWGRGGISPGSRAAPAHTPRPRPPGRPTDSSAR
jgi:hypothetical protein